MRALVQRVKAASVSIDGEIYSSIEKGMMVLLCVMEGDTTINADKLATKLVNLRIFEDENNKINLSLRDISGQMLVVSQFTLSADCKKGTRPSFDKSAKPVLANELYEYFIQKVKNLNISTFNGKFGAMMDVSIVNDGPFTVMIDK